MSASPPLKKGQLLNTGHKTGFQVSDRLDTESTIDKLSILHAVLSIFWGGSGSFFWQVKNKKIKDVLFSLYRCIPVLRSRHFFGRLQLRKSEVPEPAATIKLGRLWLQAKKGGSGFIH